MKNSVKFFFGGIIAASIIFGAFAFTTKQKENKEYLVVRVFENGKGNYLNIQECNHLGEVKTERKKVSPSQRSLFENTNADYTAEIAKVVNSYVGKGYVLVSNNSLFRQTESGFQVDHQLYSTLIFEK